MRRSVQSNGRRRDNARMSLLKNTSPPASPAGFGSSDPNVGSLYPGIGSTASFDDLTNSKGSKGSVENRLPPDNRFTPSHQPIGAKEPLDELSPEQGALQFVPAFEESNKPTWDAIVHEEKKDEVTTTTRHVVKKTHKPTDAATSVSAASRRGPRMARLASLFSSRAVVRSHHPEASSPIANRRQQVLSRSRSSDNKTPASPAHSSSSSGYVGWPGTQDKRGVTLAINSSYDDSSAGPGLRKSYEEQLKEEAEREMSRWTGSTKRTSDDFSSVGSFASTPEHGSRMAPVEMRIQGQGNNDDDEYEAGNAAADFHVTALADASAAARSPMATRTSRHAQSDIGERRPEIPRRTAGMASTSKNLFPGHSPASDSWGSYPPSSPGGTTLSKTSSAYMDVKDDLAYPDFDRGTYNPYGHRSRSRDAPGRVASQTSPQAPTKETLAANDQITPPHRTFSAPGYRGLIDKTKEVPSLMDAMDSDSMASSKATSTYTSSNPGAPNTKYAAGRREIPDDAESDVFDGLSVSKESDVFDNLSNYDKSSPRKTPRGKVSFPERIAEEEPDDDPYQEDFKVVLLGGGLTTIQTTQDYFSNRKTASDYDENLTNSEVDQYGFAKTPGFSEMLSAGTSNDNSLLGIQGNIGSRSVAREDLTESESGSSLFSDPYANIPLDVDGDLSEYYVHPSVMKKILRKYRRLSQQVNTDLTLAEFEKEEDGNKAFALFEMRSRIMEKDIERGLERQGGTVVVDDLATTPYNRAAHRIRDAVIVSKAWRDGANPSDVINTALLTRREERAYFIKRPIRSHAKMSDNVSVISGYSTSSQRYYWEAVKWVDDTDFMQYRCPSLGPRHMRGFEIFTIGDCQSILLKLTNERCIELKKALNDATKRQIEAEELMKEEGDDGDGMMTEAEETYLVAMEEVKIVSKQLVIAEKAFALVKDRIEKLVSRYETLLMKIESESFAGASSIITQESSYYSDSEYWEEEDNRERAMWARRAKRAEVRAEIAAREAQMAKQEARMIREEKQRELEALQHRLEELQSESSHAIGEREHSTILAKSFAMRRNDAPSPGPNEDNQKISKDKIDGVKQRFRDRMAAKKQVATPSPQMSRGSRYERHSQAVTPSPEKSARDELFRSAGEEMFQHLDFYERSLKAVESTRSS